MVSQEYFNIKETCKYIGWSYPKGKKKWPMLVRDGVNAMREPDSRIVFFKRSELDEWRKKQRVAKR